MHVPRVELLNETKELKMDFIAGETLADLMRHKKYKKSLEDLVDVQESVYKYSNLKLNQAHRVLKKTIKESDLQDELKDIGLTLLNQIEPKNSLCHFDMHLLNVICVDSEYYIVDWVNSKLANPILDIARTYIVLKQYASRLANKYLKLMLAKRKYTLDEANIAIRLMAILRLLENDAVVFQDNLEKIIYAK